MLPGQVRALVPASGLATRAAGRAGELVQLRALALRRAQQHEEQERTLREARVWNKSWSV